MYQYILFTWSMYWKTYIYHRVCTSIYSVHTSTYLSEKVHTWVKKYILVHTWGKKYVPVHTGLCRFISVSYHSMVHTGTYWYILVWTGYIPLVGIPDVLLIFFNLQGLKGIGLFMMS
jgi:hypothetical protein